MNRQTKRIYMRLIISLSAMLFAVNTWATQQISSNNPIAVLTIKGPITPATSDYIIRGIESAHSMDGEAVIIKIDTPGGLDLSMREIIEAILDSSIPIISYVAPKGARAASAGTYILYASHFATMAPATNLGAATPIQIGGTPFPTGASDEKGKVGEKSHPTMSDKAVNDAKAYIRSLAQMRGRNIEWAEKSVSEAASLTAKEALKVNVINFIARDIDELIAKLDRQETQIKGEKIIIETRGKEVLIIEPDWRTKLLSVITNPNIAYLLLMIGFYGLILEFTHPGAIAPGVIGVICLVIALFALHVLPVNYAGMGLIILGIAFMLAEAFVPSFGILGFGGVVAFVIGSVLLIDSDVPGFGISLPLILTMALTSGLFFMLVLTMAFRARMKPIVSGKEELLGAEGRVISWQKQEGLIRIRGEIWKAHSSELFNAGDKVRVKEIQGLVLEVVKT